jgi:protoporphyrinogen oxidase
VILILGAGITGLAAARTLAEAGVEHLVLERESEPGGWCRTLFAGGYTFDLSGHFLHFSDPEMRKWVVGLGGATWRTVQRDARVFLRRKVTPFPFQANLHGHDKAMVRRCLRDFAEARIREAMQRDRPAPHFGDWLLRRFGEAMCEEFFFPYNRKMWCTPLSGIEPSWTAWSVPVPSFEVLLEGTRGQVRDGLGYNSSFLYPSKGGIASLVAGLARGARERIRSGVSVARIDPGAKIAWSAQGEEFRYDAAIATIPLPALSAICEPKPSPIRDGGKALRWVKVLTVNLGVRSPAKTYGHWVYVPESAYPYYRVGCLSNVCRSAAPEGGASLFTERSFPSGARVNVADEVRVALSGLQRMGVLRRGQRPEEVRPVLLDPAYVIFDHARAKAVASLRGYFLRRGVFTAGRYGAWEYNGMEASMADGIRAARQAMGRLGIGPG